MAAPSPWIERFSHLLIPGSRALDLACGAGRHTRWLLHAGLEVLAVDRDLGEIADLVDARLARIETNLELDSHWPLAGRQFACIVVTNYLWRPRLQDILANVEPGGLLLYETFAAGNEAFGRPRNPDYLLRPGELLDLLADGFDIIAYEHGRLSRPDRVIQRVAARAHGSSSTVSDLFNPFDR